MSSIGLPGILLLIILALLLFGPKKLPELGRAIGRTFKEFKEGAQGIVNDQEQQTTAGNSVAGSGNQTVQNQVIDVQKTGSMASTSGATVDAAPAQPVQPAAKPDNQRLPE